MTPPEGRRGHDPSKPVQVAVVGKKGSGKTELAFMLWDSYPYDRVLVDPNGDIKVDDPDLEELDPSLPIPARFPAERLDELRPADRPRKRRTLRLIPDPSAPDFLEQMDRAVALAYGHRRTGLLFDEAHEGAPSSRTPPHMRRALRQGRHHHLTMILATPRPITVDPLVLSQADWVYVFKLPGPNDRRRVADTIGWDPKDFDDAVHALGPFEYLRYDAARDDLAHFPPLPPELIRHHKNATDGAQSA